MDGRDDRRTSSRLTWSATWRFTKERVLAIRTSATGGRGYPFGDLENIGPQVALNDQVDGSPVAVFYERRDGEAAIPYNPVVAGQTLTFHVIDNKIQDSRTGSIWSFSGVALEGPLEGE